MYVCRLVADVVLLLMRAALAAIRLLLVSIAASSESAAADEPLIWDALTASTPLADVTADPPT
mgnify:CR=1 FL=1